MVPDAKANPNKCRGPHVSKGEIIQRRSDAGRLFIYFTISKGNN